MDLSWLVEEDASGDCHLEAARDFDIVHPREVVHLCHSPEMMFWLRCLNKDVVGGFHMASVVDHKDRALDLLPAATSLREG